MQKKPLIGVSICAVVLLVMGSLSNVVGYQSVKSTVNDSPLFQTRTQRATNQQQNTLTFQYLRMGKENLLRFQMRDNKVESLRKTIESISKMDDKTFKKFRELCIQKARQDVTLQDINPEEISEILHQLTIPPERNILYQLRNNYNITAPTILVDTLCNYYLGCLIFEFLFFVYWVLVFIYMDIIDFTSQCPTAFMM